MSWLERFAKSVANIAGESVKKDVMKGSEKLGAHPTPSQRAKWIKGAMERLDALVNEETRRRIMISTCPHTYPRKRIEKLREQYKQLGSIDKLMGIMYARAVKAEFQPLEEINYFELGFAHSYSYRHRSHFLHERLLSMLDCMPCSSMGLLADGLCTPHEISMPQL